jgi:colanic acid biosynthesis glycosyl transferase WcaI
MPSVTLLTPHYFPETSAAAKRCTDTAEFLASRGWQVTVLTLLPHYPQNKIYEGFDKPIPLVTTENQVKVIRLRPWIIPRANLLLRLLAETYFVFQILLHSFWQKSDVILASSPYMFLGPGGLLASRLQGCKFVWDVRDLTWLYPKAAGKKTYGTDKVLEKLMLFTASHSDGLSTATEGLLSYFVKRPPASEVIPNGVSEALLAKLEPLTQAYQLGAFKGKVLYAGLFGYNHHLTTVIEAARLLPELSFTLAGDGPDKSLLEDLVKTNNLDNVKFTGYLSFDNLFLEYEKADILVSHVRQDPIFLWTQPVKLWEYMATGKPVIHAGEGEVVDIIQQHNLALTVAPENPQALTEAIRYLIAHPDEARQLGENGRHFVEQQRHRVKILERLEALLQRVL